MPSYDYICRDCRAAFTLRLSIATYSGGVTPRCSHCGSENAQRSFAAVNVLTGSRGTGASAAACGPSGFT